MTWTVTDDNGTINVRAIISSREEFRQLLEALGRVEEKLPPSADKASPREEYGDRKPFIGAME